MSVSIANHYNSVPISYEGTSKSDGKGGQRFDRELLQKQGENLPSFVGKVYTREEMAQYVDDQLQQNQSKKMSSYEMLAARPLAKGMRYSIAGSSKAYTFDEYVREMEKEIQELNRNNPAKDKPISQTVQKTTVKIDHADSFQSIETERYKIADASYMEGVPAYEIVDKLTGKSLYMREDNMVIQKDEKTGMEFLINMDLGQPLTSNVLMTGELRNILNDLSEKRDFDIQETPLQGGLVVNYDPKTGLNYLSISGNEAKGASVILSSEKDIETLNNLIDEFQKYAVSSQRSTAGLYAVLEISGNLVREKEGFTYLTPDSINYIPYNGDKDKAWWISMPHSAYTDARKYLHMENDCTDAQSWLRELKAFDLQLYYGDLSNADRPFANSSAGSSASSNL